MPTCGIDRDSELMKGDCPSSFLLKAISPCTNCSSLSGRHRLCAEAIQLGWVAGEVPTDEDMNLLVSRGSLGRGSLGRGSLGRAIR